VYLKKAGKIDLTYPA